MSMMLKPATLTIETPDGHRWTAGLPARALAWLRAVAETDAEVSRASGDDAHMSPAIVAVIELVSAARLAEHGSE